MGAVGQWDRGTVGQWDSGTVGQWELGQWDSGTKRQKINSADSPLPFNGSLISTRSVSLKDKDKGINPKSPKMLACVCPTVDRNTLFLTS